MDYKKAGVDIEAGYKSVELMKEHIKKTMRSEVLTNIGGFSGAFSMEKFKDMEKPTLVSGTDGVGTKLKLAFILDKHDTVGIDCVAMCVNDIACAGGEPLFFLDYIACGKNYPEKIAQIVSGVAEGCVQSDAALIGGETAEMPGFYPVDEYDLAGFAVGVVDEKDLITGKDLKEKDVLIGIASSGVHSNGFSLVRKVFSMDEKTLNTYHEELGKTLGEALIAPTKIYVKALRSIKEAGVRVKGCSHITGGGTIFSGIFNKPYDTSGKETKLGILVTMVPAAVIILFISSPFQGLIYSQMLLAVQLPITIFTQICLTSSKRVMGRYANSRRLNIVLWITALTVTFLNIGLFITAF